MKKIIVLFLTLVIIFGCFSINALGAGLNADEQDLINTLKTKIKLKGSDKDFSMTSPYIVQAENYLQIIDMTHEQYLQIKPIILDAIEEVKTLDSKVAPNGVIIFNLIPKDIRMDLINKASEAAGVINLKISLVNGKDLVISNKTTGKVVFTAGRNSAIIKATGYSALPNFSTVSILLILSLFIVLTIAIKRKRIVISKA